MAQGEQVSASTNDLYQSQVDHLREEEARQGDIDASVAGLRAQLPATGQLDDVFEIVARAATATGVTLQAVSGRGTPAGFVTRTSPHRGWRCACWRRSEAPAEARGRYAPPKIGSRLHRRILPPLPGPNSSAARSTFTISVAAADANQVTRFFLTPSEAGPRLLSNITAHVGAYGRGDLRTYKSDALTIRRCGRVNAMTDARIWMNSSSFRGARLSRV